MMLITAGANPLQVNGDGMTAHEVAIAHEQTEAAEMIGEASVKFAMATDDIQSTLKHIQLGVSPNVYNANGWTPMMLFALHGWLEGVKELLDVGGLFNVAENDGWTPLMFAAHSGASDIIDLLLSVGADFHHQSNDGRGAIDIALANERMEVVERLRSVGAEETTHETEAETQEEESQGEAGESQQEGDGSESIPVPEDSAAAAEAVADRAPVSGEDDNQPAANKPKPEIKRSNFNSRNSKKEQDKKGFFNFWN